jgi:hypothetical protein
MQHDESNGDHHHLELEQPIECIVLDVRLQFGDEVDEFLCQFEVGL